MSFKASFPCNACQRVYTDKKRLTVHQLDDHGLFPSENQWLSCFDPTCPKKFLQSSERLDHMKLFHENFTLQEKPRTMQDLLCIDRYFDEMVALELEALQQVQDFGYETPDVEIPEPVSVKKLLLRASPPRTRSRRLRTVGQALARIATKHKDPVKVSRKRRKIPVARPPITLKISNPRELLDNLFDPESPIPSSPEESTKEPMQTVSSLDDSGMADDTDGYNDLDRYCVVCSVFVPDTITLEDHESSQEHINRLKFTCETCDRGFSSGEIWINHRLSMCAPNLECHTCRLEFSSEDEFASHFTASEHLRKSGASTSVLKLRKQTGLLEDEPPSINQAPPSKLVKMSTKLPVAKITNQLPEKSKSHHHTHSKKKKKKHDRKTDTSYEQNSSTAFADYGQSPQPNHRLHGQTNVFVAAQRNPYTHSTVPLKLHVLHPGSQQQAGPSRTGSHVPHGFAYAKRGSFIPEQQLLPNYDTIQNDMDLERINRMVLNTALFRDQHYTRKKSGEIPETFDSFGRCRLCFVVSDFVKVEKYNAHLGSHTHAHLEAIARNQQCPHCSDVTIYCKTTRLCFCCHVDDCTLCTIYEKYPLEPLKLPTMTQFRRPF